MSDDAEFPRETESLEPVWIPMPDGCRLAARIWRPKDAAADPVPAIVEAIPYRWRDGTRSKDERVHGFYAGHGYASVRIDLRGSGQSDGLMADEYTVQEQDDIVAAIDWIAAQPWCTGAVGMMGISWGGFNSLQVAARRPPALKAIVTSCSTDDRYADDVHYMGGCMLADNVSWGATMWGLQSRPPDPAVVGEDGLLDGWLERLEAEPLFLETWAGHQRRDAYWKQGSVCEDFGAIECAVFAIGGWADSYTNAIPRLLAGLDAPRLGVIGPWGHFLGFEKAAGMPGPGIDFLGETLRWWDHWLKGAATGIMAEPMLRAFMQGPTRPAAACDRVDGRWVAEPAWPAPDAGAPRELHLNDGTLAEAPAGGNRTLTVCSPQVTGVACGEWCTHGSGTDLAGDQREDDAFSMVFDGAPLDETLEVLGAPEVELAFAVDRPNAMIAVRLNDVWPDGASTRVSFALANLNHAPDHETAAALEPGRTCRVTLKLNDIGYAFAPGHRLRIAISTVYWPMAWPAPAPVTLSMQAGSGVLRLPVRRPRPEDDGVAFGAPRSATPAPVTVLEEPCYRRTVERDLDTGRVVTTIVENPGRKRHEATGWEEGAWRTERLAIDPDDPLSAEAEIRYDFLFARDGREYRSNTRTRMTATAEDFVIEADVDAFEGDNRLFARRYERRVPRDFN